MSRRMRWLIASLLLIVVILSGFILFREQLGSMNIENTANFLRGLGPWAILLGGGLIILQTFFPFIPFLVLAGANVLVFGLWGGFLINWISAVMASILMFIIARTVGRDWAKHKMEKFPKFQRADQFLEKNGFKTVFFLRLFPVVPPVVVNLAAGLSTMEANAFIFATVLGKVPAILVESLIGNDLFHFQENKARLLVIALGFGVILLVGMSVLRKKWKLS